MFIAHCWLARALWWIIWIHFFQVILFCLFYKTSQRKTEAMVFPPWIMWHHGQVCLSVRFLTFYIYCSESSSRCPIDNYPLSETDLFLDSCAEREILQLCIKCPNHALGCTRIVELMYIEHHTQACSFQVSFHLFLSHPQDLLIAYAVILLYFTNLFPEIYCNTHLASHPYARLQFFFYAEWITSHDGSFVL